MNLTVDVLPQKKYFTASSAKYLKLSVGNLISSLLGRVQVGTTVTRRSVNSYTKMFNMQPGL
jgi:hypothetical protein